MPRLLLMLVLTIGLAACGGQRDPEEHVWKTQTDALEKAKQLEDQLKQADLERRKAIQATETGGSVE